MLDKVKEHKMLIADLQNSKDQTMFITASKDNTAKVCGYNLAGHASID